LGRHASDSNVESQQLVVLTKVAHFAKKMQVLQTLEKARKAVTQAGISIVREAAVPEGPSCTHGPADYSSFWTCRRGSCGPGGCGRAVSGRGCCRTCWPGQRWQRRGATLLMPPRPPSSCGCGRRGKRRRRWECGAVPTRCAPTCGAAARGGCTAGAAVGAAWCATAARSASGRTGGSMPGCACRQGSPRCRPRLLAGQLQQAMLSTQSVGLWWWLGLLLRVQSRPATCIKKNCAKMCKEE
jgi:hypothetical protein